jgi:tetratricopeptide (TPR) repeat protein
LTTHRARSRVAVALVVLIAAAGSFANGFATTDSRKLCRQYLRTVKVHMAAGRPDSAVVYATRAMECDPSQADSYWYLAHAQLELGDSGSARSTVDRGVVAAPRSQRLNLFRARLCLDTGDVAIAREIVEKILVLPMNRGEALYLRGQIELVEGDSLAAMASWREALEETLGEEARR